MVKYELVILVDQTLSKSDIEKTISNVEEKLGQRIIEKDDIWLLDLATEIKWNSRAYFVSYCLQMETVDVKLFSNEFSLTKWLVRFFFYKMTKNEKFLKFKVVNEEFKLTQEEKKKQQNEKAFKDMDLVKNLKK